MKLLRLLSVTFFLANAQPALADLVTPSPSSDAMLGFGLVAAVSAMVIGVLIGRMLLKNREPK